MKLRTSALLILATFHTLGADEAAATKPNIVVILIDDMGYADIGPFGATRQKTPRLDRMAAEGMRMTSFYAAPVCSVSRAQLMTGCYGARVSVPGVFFPGQSVGLHPSETTIAERLKEQGYATQCVGKWHLGDQPEFLPTRQGFDHYFGFPYSNDMLKAAASTGEKVVPLLRDDKVVELLNAEQQSLLVERYTEEAVGFIRREKDRPFFLYLPHNAVHTPIHPGKAFQGKSGNGRFGDWVEEVDWSVGRVLDTLRELKLEEKTLVVFTSDNGPWLVQGNDGGSALPLRGGKGGTWEGGVRVPTIVWWPGKVAAGTSCDTVAGTIDLLPTAVALAGGKLPPEPVIDGRDIMPVLLGKTQESPREAHYYFASYELQAVRQGTWKLALTDQNENMGRKATDEALPNPRLYDLGNDIGERTNVAAQHPDIVERLTRLAAKKNAEIGGKNPTARRPAGEVPNPRPLYPLAEEKKAGAAKTPTQLSELKPGDVLSSQAAPQVGGKAFTLSCVVTTAQRDAILVAHGGASAGYALHLRGGKAVFAIRTKDGDARVETPLPATVENLALSAGLAADGTLSLRLGDQPAVTTKGPGLLAKQPQEDFCVGHDNGNPVAAYGAKGPFEGKITGLAVSFP